MELEHEPERSRAEPGQLPLAVLTDRVAVNFEGARVGVIECSEDVQQGALPRTRRAEYCQKCATFDLEVEVA